MTGTSFDGIDCALLRTDGDRVIEFGPALTFPHPESRRRALAEVMGQRAAPVELVEELTDAHAEAVKTLLERTNMARTQIRAIGFHGQTILHAPKNRLTVQIGDGNRLAQILGIEVVEQFRIADVEAGGEGAPLAPVFHRVLLQQLPLPAVMVNIGGVANITWTDGHRILACDTGPGNARLDDLMRTHCGQDFDEDGRIAASGTVDESVVAACLSTPFFQLPPPKSLDRDDIQCSGFERLPTEDAAATHAAIAADSIALIRQHLPAEPAVWVVSGGGRKNQAIMARLRSKIPARVIIAEEIGLDGDGMEAHLFAYLAARRLRGLPSSFPGTTGVPQPTICGRICPAPGQPSLSWVNES